MPGGNTGGSQNGYRKGGFFSTAAQTAAIGRQGIDGAVIGAFVGHPAAAPEIHSHGGIQCGKIPDLIPDLLIKEPTAVHNFFVIDPGIEDVMKENIFRNIPAEGTVLPEKQSVIYVGNQSIIGYSGKIQSGEGTQSQFQQVFPGTGQRIQMGLPLGSQFPQPRADSQPLFVGIF